MKLKIYTTIKVKGSKEYVVGEGNLFEYLSELNPDFFRFDIQRKIVANHYLDSLSDSVKNGMPFPAITLTYAGKINDTNLKELNLRECEILDGLQRTFRLWSIYYIDHIIETNPYKDYREIYNLLKDDKYGGKYIIEAKTLKRSQLRALMEIKDGRMEISALLDSFRKYSLIFNIWIGLTDQDIVRQMLILNAGHKRVTNTHQFELVYLHYFDKKILQIPQAMKILREKDEEYKLIGRPEKRQRGMFALSSVMIAFQSYYMGKPMRVMGVNEVSLDFEHTDITTELSKALIGGALNEFIKCIDNLDRKMCDVEYGGYWFSKDTTISGIFAAIGASMPDKTVDYDDFTYLEDFISRFNPDDLNLKNYDEGYDTLSSARINVGNKVRLAVFKAFSNYVPGNNINWIEAFN